MKKNQLKKQEDTAEIQCNMCGKIIQTKADSHREEFFSGEVTWGYFSEKDGEVHSFHLCEKCYDQLIGKFKIPVHIQPVIEYM